MENTENITGSKSAGDTVKEKQSTMDKAVNQTTKENDLTRAETERLKTRRDHSEKRKSS